MNPEAYLEMDETEATHWWFSARRMILSSIIRRFNLSKNSKILEVGCGTGGNLEMLSSFGDVSGLEMDADACAIATRKTKQQFDIRAGSCPDQIPFYTEPFDLICMFDVLEHIDEDIQTLKSLQKLLTKNGKILITVPAYKFLWGAHDEFLHHKRRYTISELKEKLELSNLYATKLSYFNTLLFPLVAIIRIKEKILKNSNSRGTETPLKSLNLVLQSIFGIERYILPFVNFPFGVSLLAVVKAKK